MKPHYQDDWLTVYHGDCRAVMADMEPESVHCAVTSPPYWGLRDYGTPEQLGLERTPEEYVANLVAVFREVWRVLRKDGTVWLNLGDSYNAYNGGAGPSSSISAGAQSEARPRLETGYGLRTKSLKPKDLVGIPWRVAFALQADGWYLRSDIIWSKPNPMPESVTDRPTKSHEYLFLLSKSPRYYFDADAVAERVTPSTVARLSQATLDAQHGSDRVPGKTNGPMKAVGKLTGGAYAPPGQPPSSNARPTWQERKAAGAHAGGHGPGQIEGSGTQRNVHGEGMTHDLGDPGIRNIRSVWTIATQPYHGAHFATFPPKLVEPCIKAGTSERGVCPECGAPWERETRKDVVAFSSSPRYTGNGDRNDSETGRTTTTTTTGWRPSCAHAAEPVPATVLDPFAGSGTTGMVAQSLSRRAVLIDLSLDYLGQLMDRNADIPLGLGA